MGVEYAAAAMSSEVLEAAELNFCVGLIGAAHIRVKRRPYEKAGLGERPK